MGKSGIASQDAHAKRKEEKKGKALPTSSTLIGNNLKALTRYLHILATVCCWLSQDFRL